MHIMTAVKESDVFRINPCVTYPPQRTRLLSDVNVFGGLFLCWSTLRMPLRIPFRAKQDTSTLRRCPVRLVWIFLFPDNDQCSIHYPLHIRCSREISSGTCCSHELMHLSRLSDKTQGPPYTHDTLKRIASDKSSYIFCFFYSMIRQLQKYQVWMYKCEEKVCVWKSTYKFSTEGWDVCADQFSARPLPKSSLYQWHQNKAVRTPSLLCLLEYTPVVGQRASTVGTSTLLLSWGGPKQPQECLETTWNPCVCLLWNTRLHVWLRGFVIQWRRLQWNIWTSHFFVFPSSPACFSRYGLFFCLHRQRDTSPAARARQTLCLDRLTVLRGYF